MTYAIYFESRGSEEAVRQDLFIPAASLGSTVLRPSLAYKELTPASPARTWKVIKDSAYAPSSRHPESVTELLSHELGQLSSLSSYFVSILTNPEWDLIGSFPILMTDNTKLELMESPDRVPAELNKKIRVIRDRKGWLPLPRKE